MTRHAPSAYFIRFSTPEYFQQSKYAIHAGATTLSFSSRHTHTLYPALLQLTHGPIKTEKLTHFHDSSAPLNTSRTPQPIYLYISARRGCGVTNLPARVESLVWSADAAPSDVMQMCCAADAAADLRAEKSR